MLIFLFLAMTLKDKRAETSNEKHLCLWPSFPVGKAIHRSSDEPSVIPCQGAWYVRLAVLSDQWNMLLVAPGALPHEI